MSDTGTRFELHLREDVPPHTARRQRDVLERLEEAASAVSVRRWPKRVNRWSDGEVLERFEEFAAWADEAGVDLSPFFGSRGTSSVEGSRRVDALALPVCCLAVYRGDDLVAVYPHARGEDSRSVPDALEALGGSDAGTALDGVGAAD